MGVALVQDLAFTYQLSAFHRGDMQVLVVSFC